MQPILPPFFKSHYSVGEQHVIETPVTRNHDTDELVLLTVYIDTYGSFHEMGYGMTVRSITNRQAPPRHYLGRQECKALIHPLVKVHIMPWVKNCVADLLDVHKPPVLIRRMYQTVPKGDPPPARFVDMTDFLETQGYPVVAEFAAHDRWFWRHHRDPTFFI